MVGKYVALLDWELAVMKTGEYYCPKVADMVLKATGQCVEAAKRLAERRPEDIKKILEGLIQSGLGIAYTGTSRPASGTEHMIGQTWEVIDLEHGREPHLHGIDVGQATFTAILMYERLYEETQDPALKELIGKYLPYFARVKELQEIIRLPFMVTDKEDFISGILRGRTFRVRYTLLQYLYDLGMLEDYAEYAYEMQGTAKKHRSV
jgi:glycerol-1-phosphate dehydrogenase [NAD(P)+]